MLTLFNASSTFFSVSASRLAVISSSRSSSGFAAAALAIDNNCHCPCEKSSGLHIVSYPLSSSIIASWIPAALAASITSSSVIDTSYSVIWSLTVPETIWKVCSTYPYILLFSLSGIAVAFWPAIDTLPLSGS